MTTHLLKEEVRKVEVPAHAEFKTLDEAFSWCVGLINKGLPVLESRLKADSLRKRHDMYFKVFGVSKSTEKVVRKIEPAGVWRVEVETPGTTFYRAGILGPYPVETVGYRFSCWYSRFLPYAVAMLKSEHGFEALGVDFSSINSYYGTCYGFQELGFGDGFAEAKDGKPEYNRIDPADVELFQECHSAASAVMPPDLPFDEVHRACMVYVALARPQDVIKTCHPTNSQYRETGEPVHWWYRFIARAVEKMGKPQPFDARGRVIRRETKNG